MTESFDVAVAVSGGVDSLYALLSLKEAGLRVVALHARLHEGAEGDGAVPGLREACSRIGVPLFVEDLRGAFREAVVLPFGRDYAAGRTPNPCARCNRLVKFGLLADAAGRIGAAALATGHYVGVIDHPRYGRVIAPAADAAKDQGYFLALVPPERVLAAVFPLAGVTKERARAFVAAGGVAVPAPRESQDICFVPDGDYRAALAASGVPLPASGDVEFRGRVVGRHRGLWRYTEGQRRRLGIAWSEPLYVVAKDAGRNVLVVGTAEDVVQDACTVGDVNFFVPFESWPARLRVRLRYRQGAVPAVVRREGDGLRCVFARPEQRVAPGQVAAVYDGDGILLAGGILRG